MAKKPEQFSVIDMFARLGHDLRMPEIDIEKNIEHNRRNLEAFERSAKAASAGASSVMARQREMLQETLRDVSDMAESYRKAGDPREMMTTQADFARKSFETAVRNTGEVADLVRKSSSEAIDILRQRIRDGMDEIRDSYEKRK